MNRFFVQEIKLSGNYIILDDPEQLHHLRDVLRIKTRQKAAIFDNSGSEYIVLVCEITGLSAKLEILEKKMHQPSGVKITVACAIPKNVKMDDIVDKLTQLGVDALIPLITKRVIVKMDKQKKLQRLARWEKIALSAAKQSGRSRLAVIKPIIEFNDLIREEQNFDLKLIPTLEGPRKTLKEVFNTSSGKISSVLILIGPEGDFDALEIASAVRSGFLPVSLGERVLRVDTAAVAAVSFIRLNE